MFDSSLTQESLITRHPGPYACFHRGSPQLLVRGEERTGENLDRSPSLSGSSRSCCEEQSGWRVHQLQPKRERPGGTKKIPPPPLQPLQPTLEPVNDVEMIQLQLKRVEGDCGMMEWLTELEAVLHWCGDESHEVRKDRWHQGRLALAASVSQPPSPLQ